MSSPFSVGSFSRTSSEAFPGIVVDGKVYPLDAIAQGRWPTTLALIEDWEAGFQALSAFAQSPNGQAIPIEDLDVMIPVEPRQIICAGANYRKHVVDLIFDHEASSYPDLLPGDRRKIAEQIMDHRAAEGQPYAFVKPFSSLLAPFGALPLPQDSHEVDWELELAVVIGKPARRVPRERALDFVAGYSIANDISARDHIRRPDFPGLGMDWMACKGKPGFLPFGPTIVPAAFISDPQDLLITLKLNGEIMQNESTADMIFGVAQLIEFISTHIQLLPGDVICTGSPSGNGTHHQRFLRPGDIMDGSIAGLGTQRISCVAETVIPGAAQHRPFEPLVLK